MTEKTIPLIFLAFANDYADPKQHLRSLRDEARQLRDTLKQAQKDGLCEVVERPNATAEEIIQVFQDERDRIAVFHFAGHANGYQLLLETAQSRDVAVAHGAGFAEFLGVQHGLQLVFLNACATEPNAEACWMPGSKPSSPLRKASTTGWRASSRSQVGCAPRLFLFGAHAGEIRYFPRSRRKSAAVPTGYSGLNRIFRMVLFYRFCSKTHGKP